MLSEPDLYAVLDCINTCIDKARDARGITDHTGEQRSIDNHISTLDRLASRVSTTIAHDYARAMPALRRA